MPLDEAVHEALPDAFDDAFTDRVANDNAGGPAAGARVRRWRPRRWAIGAAGTLALAIAAIGALHTAWGRPLLARLGGCPALRASARDVDALRLRGFAGALRGAAAAPARPALGFQLDRTSAADVTAWAAAAQVTCAQKRRGLLAIHCADVPRAALPTFETDHEGAAVIEDLAFTFAPNDRLVSVDAFTRRLPEGAAAATYASSSTRLMASLGTPTDRLGGDSASALSLFGAARRRYRFRDYAAIVSLSRLPDGLAVREQYLSGS